MGFQGEGSGSCVEASILRRPTAVPFTQHSAQRAGEGRDTASGESAGVRLTDGVSQERRRNVGEMAGEARFSREMAAARGLNGDPAQARRDSPDPGRRHDGRGHLAAIFWRRAGRAAAEKSRARLIQ